MTNVGLFTAKNKGELVCVTKRKGELGEKTKWRRAEIIGVDYVAHLDEVYPSRPRNKSDEI